jgi:uncharacterized protein (DUF488 family)
MGRTAEKRLYTRALKRWENEGGSVGPDSEPTAIWTIGHSTRDITSFIDLLSANDIEAVADVRSLPGSRKFPQFNAEELAVSLPEHGIEYIPFKQLGGRRKARKDSPNTVWRHPAFRGYADYMETEDFEKGIEELLAVAGQKRMAIMCSEAVWWRCHRSMISDKLKSIGVTVIHIMDGKNVVHPYTPAARIVGGALVYGSGE